MDQQEAKFRKMTEPPVGGLICRLAVPCIISMLVTSFYNMADVHKVFLERYADILNEVEQKLFQNAAENPEFQSNAFFLI